MNWDLSQLIDSNLLRQATARRFDVFERKRKEKVSAYKTKIREYRRRIKDIEKKLESLEQAN